MRALHDLRAPRGWRQFVTGAEYTRRARPRGTERWAAKRSSGPGSVSDQRGPLARPAGGWR